MDWGPGVLVRRDVADQPVCGCAPQPAGAHCIAPRRPMGGGLSLLSSCLLLQHSWLAARAACWPAGLRCTTLCLGRDWGAGERQGHPGQGDQVRAWFCSVPGFGSLRLARLRRPWSLLAFYYIVRRCWLDALVLVVGQRQRGLRLHYVLFPHCCGERPGRIQRRADPQHRSRVPAQLGSVRRGEDHLGGCALTPGLEQGPLAPDLWGDPGGALITSGEHFLLYSALGLGLFCPGCVEQLPCSRALLRASPVCNSAARLKSAHLLGCCVNRHPCIIRLPQQQRCGRSRGGFGLQRTAWIPSCVVV